MNSPTPSEITELVRAWSAGDREALSRLVPLVYPELKRLASQQIFRLGGGETLRVTALVHETYLKLAGKPSAVWKDRVHFFALASQIMRGILVDHARAKHAAKRGGDAITIAIDGAIAPTDQKGIDVLALDEALERLAKLNPEQAKIVELRFFGGISIEEAAEALGRSSSTVKREWVLAKTWIHRELMKAGHGS
jgi:RNA polymerase sigma-70 factor (ECF subfamily)